MPYNDFLWTDEIIAHLAENGVSPDDFEYVVNNPDSITSSHSTGLPAVFGYAPDGRLIFAVYEELDDGTILPTTAYEISQQD